MNIRLLCLSLWTPPLVRPQSILIGKLVPEWIRQRLKPVIINYDICGHWDIDVPIYSIPVMKTIRGARYLPLIESFQEKQYLKKIYNIVSKIVRQNQINLIFSFANPQVSNLLGAMLKERLGIKFISHFSDPFIDNPYKSFNSWQAKRVANQEKYILEQSDRAVFVNPDLKRLVLEKYSSSIQAKGEVISHCYDKRLYPKGTKSNKRFVLSHIGAFYKRRNPEIIFKALSLLKERKKDFPKKFLLKLIGGVNDYAGYSHKSLERLIEKFQLVGIVDIIPAMSYNGSLQAMVDSDCLLLVDANIPQSPFLPSKLIDYLGSNTNVIAITPQGSPPCQVTNRLGGKSFDYSEKEALVEYLGKLIAGEASFSLNQNYAEEFDVRQISKKWLALFKEVLDES